MNLKTKIRNWPFFTFIFEEHVRYNLRFHIKAHSCHRISQGELRSMLWQPTQKSDKCLQRSKNTFALRQYSVRCSLEAFSLYREREESSPLVRKLKGHGSTPNVNMK